MRGWLEIGVLLLALVACAAVGGMMFVSTVMEIAARATELRSLLAAGFVPGGRLAQGPADFSDIVRLVTSLVMVGAPVYGAVSMRKAKRASGQGWVAYFAAIAAATNKAHPSLRPAGSPVGNFLAWVLLVPVSILGLLLVFVLVTMK